MGEGSSVLFHPSEMISIGTPIIVIFMPNLEIKCVDKDGDVLLLSALILAGIILTVLEDHLKEYPILGSPVIQ
ncbi:MAG: hypothetical protein LR000_00110 [Candidatus Pacebacteria bacterium]|nr:hypothetical protein [Candidatus Paceibacterota bacterium]